MQQRLVNVRVRLRVTAEKPAENGHKTAQIKKVPRAQPTVRRLRKIQHEQPPTRPQHPQHLANARVEIREIAQAVTDRHRGERAIAKRQPQRVPAQPHRRLRQPARRGAFARHREHRPAEIQADHAHVLPRARLRDIARAAAQIQQALARLQIRQPDQTTLPQPVNAETLEVVDEVVTRGNRREQIVYLAGTLLAGDVEFIAHFSRAKIRAAAGPRKNQLARAARSNAAGPDK